MVCCVAWWSCVIILSPTVFAQLSQDSYQRCYGLLTTRQCFKTARSPVHRIQNFTGAIHWCAEQGYSLAKIESAEVQAAAEQFLEDFELIFHTVWIAAMKKLQWTWVNGVVFNDGRLCFNLRCCCCILKGLPNVKSVYTGRRGLQ